MSKIREYAKKVGFQIVGTLSRRTELEYEIDPYTLTRKRSKSRAYTDEAGNEYTVSKRGVCIVDVEGGVI